MSPLFYYRQAVDLDIGVQKMEVMTVVYSAWQYSSFWSHMLYLDCSGQALIRCNLESHVGLAQTRVSFALIYSDVF